MEWALRWLHLVLGLWLLGGSTVLLLAGPGGGDRADRWRRRLLRLAPWLAAAWLVLMVALLANQAAAATGRPEAGWQLAEWQRVLLQTHFGRVWMLRQGLGAALLAVLLLQPRLASRIGPVPAISLVLVLSLVLVTAGAWAGHGIAIEPAAPAIALAAAHLLAAGLWAGGLPAILLGLAAAARQPDPVHSRWMALLLRRFSVLATACVLALAGSGLVLTYIFAGAPTEWPAGPGEWVAGLFSVLERFSAPLLSTPYGQLVLLKMALLLLVLWIASRVRWTWMPRLLRPGGGAAGDWSASARLVRAELLVVLLLLLLAARVAATIPAAHAELQWPLAFRLSAAATWPLPQTRAWALAGLAAMIAALPLLLLERARAAAAVLFTGGATGLAWALSVPAYPDTYRRPEVAYNAVSVARGMRLYAPHCAGCHGPAGRGDGPLAARLVPPPSDLSEPHTALHTAGDIFWWLTHGKAGTAMPGFADRMTPEQRWDTINFLRAFSAGYQARLLTPRVMPGQPWLATPDFDFTLADGQSASLKELRGSIVLLVFYRLPGSQPRLDQLAGLQPRLRAAGVVTVTVPLPGSPAAAAAAMPHALGGEPAADAAQAYLLFRRTLRDAGRTIAAESPPHMEFLIDRFGYTRARWLPHEEETAAAWMDESFLSRQLAVLQHEPRLRPAPDDHVH